MFSSCYSSASSTTYSDDKTQNFRQMIESQTMLYLSANWCKIRKKIKGNRANNIFWLYSGKNPVSLPPHSTKTESQQGCQRKVQTEAA